MTVVSATDAPVLIFDSGIPGFGQARRFVLSDLTDDGMFQSLDCLDDASLSMVVASPWIFFPDYVADVPEQDRQILDLDDPADVALFCSVLVDSDYLTMNLRAPFVTNSRTHRARQVVLDDHDLSMRAPLISEG